jgi:hypothetical protein
MRKATVNIKFLDLLELSIKAIDFLDDIVNEKLEQYNKDQAQILENILAEQSKCKFKWLANFLVKIGFYESPEQYANYLKECKSISASNSVYKFFKDEVFIFNASKEKQEAINISKSINYLARNYFDETADVEIDVIVLAIIKKLANKENVN